MEMTTMVTSAARIALALILLAGSSCTFGPFSDPAAGGNVAISTAEQDQEYPRMIPDGSGNAILVWSDQQIHAQKLDDAMRFLWGADGVIVTDADGWQQRSEICSDGAGGVIVVWEDCRGGVDNRDIYVQRITGSGTPAWTPNGIALTTAAGDQTSPVIVADGSGGAIVAWEDTPYGNSDIYAQRLDGNGTVQWTAGGVPVAEAAYQQHMPRMIADGSGNVILAWTDRRGGGDTHVYGQKIDADGTMLWTANGEAICTTSDSKYHPQLAPAGDGGAYLVWETLRNSYDIYAQRVDTDGGILWNPDGVPICTLEATQWDPRIVAVGGSGGAVIAWTDFRNTAHWYGRDLFGDSISATGVKR